MDKELELKKNIGKEGIWINSNYKEIQEKYDNKFVAVAKEHIVAAGKDFDNILNIVKSRRINPASVVIEFIPESETILIL